VGNARATQIPYVSLSYHKAHICDRFSVKGVFRLDNYAVCGLVGYDRYAAAQSNGVQAEKPTRALPPELKMKCPFRLNPAVPSALALILFLMAACGTESTKAPSVRDTFTPAPRAEEATAAASDAGTPETEQAFEVLSVSLQNQGGEMEGHTPRGFQGMGTGLFAGDNLNPRFPNGDGVQIFLTFDLSAVPSGVVGAAVLHSDAANTIGMPLKDLGPLRAEEVRYDSFSKALWNLEPTPGGAVCVLATSAEGPFQCDLSGAVQRSLDDSYGFAQFRLRLERAGDGDGRQDLLAFFKSDSNSNEPGIFQLDISVVPN